MADVQTPRLGTLRLGPKFGDVRIACGISERHRRSATVVDHPIETGSSIQDNRITGPREFDLDGICTDTTSEDIVEPLPTPRQSYQALTELFDSSDTFTLQTGLVVYRNMVLTDFVVTRDKDHGQVLRFTTTAKQIVFSDSKTIEVQAPTTNKVVGKNSLGSKDKKKASEADTKEQGSLLRKLVDKGGGVEGIRTATEDFMSSLTSRLPGFP